MKPFHLFLVENNPVIKSDGDYIAHYKHATYTHPDTGEPLFTSKPTGAGDRYEVQVKYNDGTWETKGVHDNAYEARRTHAQWGKSWETRTLIDGNPVKKIPPHHYDPSNQGWSLYWHPHQREVNGMHDQSIVTSGRRDIHGFATDVYGMAARDGFKNNVHRDRNAPRLWHVKRSQ